ncbi:unnamed protein product [Polarella glacialis]|uniref:Magnesium-protoporphyrin IX methyltransferase C-terminal domain-containing protein n=1 Tax=Polarella glacialis TaxID=89957 RepID=A0A813KL49_POLGL|nr:unnamed protein product [Polarella glacialis]|mmetsp:Transcript_5349/g.8696  ORF Transcript_5349/g.8696 Transcript_5349/m.8696 type:complete len:340 (-) Transcript_5349:51-1070(-)|eukprot:CAMPEP_0115120552 /NCGR_PEP_ID=MMETSP0227-20121206/45754_1 /TAXON_ID=89957 /ORGANISM="Polarella glacialis, Strain CCMP 1383" /LENGTH=339 /DNA_ID=CAMNT_0002522233 /DNA_START=50 /DNA_END=1069 /DNA_ORIENTATION=+
MELRGQLRSLRRQRCFRRIILGGAVVVGSCWSLGGSSSQGDFVPPAPVLARTGLAQGIASLVASPILLGATPALAAEAAGDSSVSPVAGVAVLAVLGAALLVLTGDQKFEAVDDTKVVEQYFNGEGFGRWQKIYGDTDDVNPVQKDIRVGHAETVDKILGWLDDATISGKTVCDAGCGTGLLSIPLASRGAVVSGSDISAAMVGEAKERASDYLLDNQMPNFSTSDLEKLSGKFDTVCCVDVLIHYPPEKMKDMVKHLAGLSNDRLVLSFAPKTWYYVALKRFGELFPGKSKTTRAYLHEEELVEKALEEAGYKVTRREMTGTKFYFSRLLEAVPKTAA